MSLSTDLRVAADQLWDLAHELERLGMWEEARQLKAAISPIHVVARTCEALGHRRSIKSPMRGQGPRIEDVAERLEDAAEKLEEVTSPGLRRTIMTSDRVREMIQNSTNAQKAAELEMGKAQRAARIWQVAVLLLGGLLTVVTSFLVRALTR
jgi:hypothetical protein